MNNQWRCTSSPRRVSALQFSTAMRSHYVPARTVWQYRFGNYWLVTAYPFG